MSANERSLLTVPMAVRVILPLALIAQAGFAWTQHQYQNAVTPYRPPPETVLQVAALGDGHALARALTIHLQTHDGLQTPGGWEALDYGQIMEWLELILRLDPHSQYPMLLASRIYAETPVPWKQRQMLEFVHREFVKDPNRRWAALAHGVILARHQLNDLPLAQRFARDLRLYAIGPDVPTWAKQMDIFILEDMSEYDAARVLLGALLESGQIKSPGEFRFLKERLDLLKEKTIHQN